MKQAAARATKRADQPPSTPGTSAGRTRLWPVAVSVLALAIIGVGAQVVAAEPASAPVEASAVAAVEATIVATTEPAAAAPARPVRREETRGTAFRGLGDATLVSGAITSGAAAAVDPTPPPPPPTTTTTTAPPAPAPAPAPAPVAAPEPSSGRCGGDLPPCYVMNRESGGNIRAENPSSSASGKWQFIDSTWNGYGGYGHASQAPESVQDAKAREMWAGGAGCSHWSAC